MYQAGAESDGDESGGGGCVRSTSKTICLAVSPALKAYGIPGRARLFEVEQRIKKANYMRQKYAPGHQFTGASCDTGELFAHPEYAIDYIIAPPRMSLYMEQSTRIYKLYLKYVAPEDIHIYSIDEVFIDLTDYLPSSGKTAREFAREIDPGCAADHRNHSHSRNRHQSLPCQDRHGHYGQAHPPQMSTACALLFWMRGNTAGCSCGATGLLQISGAWEGAMRKSLEENGIFTMGDVARCSLGRAGGLL